MEEIITFGWGKIYDGQVITNPKKMADHLIYHGNQVKYMGRRYLVALVSYKSPEVLLTDNETGKVSRVSLNCVRVVRKRPGEPYGMDLITVVDGVTTETAGQFWHQQTDLRRRFHNGGSTLSST